MSEEKVHSKTRQKNLYILLWGTTLFIAIVMMLIEIYGYPVTKKQIMKPGFDVTSVTNKTIDDLLLSSKDLNIDEKKSFINLYLRSDNAFEKLVPRTQSASIYNKIFKQKVDILKKKHANTDFAIKPIPK